MNRRQSVLGLLESDRPEGPVPAAFFVHFGQEYRSGAAAVERHVEYFRRTDMDFVKVQYEDLLPRRPDIESPADWATVEPVGKEFFRNPLEVLEALIEELGTEALIVQSTYSPFSLAAFTTGFDVMNRHLQEDPDAVRAGLEAVTESLVLFIRECIALGVDGFYASTHGGDETMFGGSPIFEDYIKPHDVALLEAMERCRFNILHICDYFGPYPDLEPYLDYPGHVVTRAVHHRADELGGGLPLLRETGHGRHGSQRRHRRWQRGRDRSRSRPGVLAGAPERFVLGADCTLPDDGRLGQDSRGRRRVAPGALRGR